VDSLEIAFYVVIGLASASIIAALVALLKPTKPDQWN
jgi:hypothetical protein